MTTHEAAAIIAQLDIVPKRTHVKVYNLNVDDKGRASVEVITEATQPTISRWFEQTGAMVTRVESVPFYDARIIWFDWQ